MDGKLCIRLLRAMVAVCLLGFFLFPADVWSQNYEFEKWFEKAEKKCTKEKKEALKRCDKLLGEAFAIDSGLDEKKWEQAMTKAYACTPEVNDAFDKCSGYTTIVDKQLGKLKDKKNKKVVKKYEKKLDKCASTHEKELKGCKKQKEPEKSMKCLKDSVKKVKKCQKKALAQALKKVK